MCSACFPCFPADGPEEKVAALGQPQDKISSFMDIAVPQNQPKMGPGIYGRRQSRAAKSTEGVRAFDQLPAPRA